MKISAQEEYGLRIMLVIAREARQSGLTIHEIAERENLPLPNVAKLLRILRLKGLLTSQRGKNGGYLLSRPAEQIGIQELLEALGGKMYEERFCLDHSGIGKLCTNSVDCSIRSLWRVIQVAVNNALKDISLAHLMAEEGHFQESVLKNLESALSAKAG